MASEHAIIEVLVTRADITEGDTVQVLLNGQPISEPQVRVVMLDVGKGWTRAEWRDYQVQIEALDLSPACLAEVTAAFDRNAESEYIE